MSRQGLIQIDFWNVLIQAKRMQEQKEMKAPSDENQLLLICVWRKPLGRKDQYGD